MSDPKISVTQPSMPKLDDFIPYLKKIWDNKWLTNNGEFHKRFEAAITLLDSAIAPEIANIPGDVLTIGEIADKISRKYKLDNGRFEPIDEDFFPGDQELDGAFFNQNIKFERKYTFDDWLARA